MSSSINASEADTTKFLKLLEAICEQQRIISEQLNELRLLMQLPSEDVLRVLEGLLIPMGQNMTGLVVELKKVLEE